MSISNSYPTQNPVLNLNFATGSDQFLDSRISFSRPDTPPTYAAPSAVHYWSNEKHLSSENTQTDSDTLGSATDYDATLSSGGQVGPDGSTTNASLLTGGAGTALKGFFFGTSAILQTVSFFAKEGTHRYIQLSVEGDSTKFVNFDLNGAGAKTANGSGVTASVTASGNGYLRCAVNLTVPSAGNVYITLQDSLGAGRENQTSSTGTVYFHGLQTTTLGDATNVAAYNATTTQIHRSYASTLKSVANAGDPRFEFDPITGNAEGLLIESQATQYAHYSEQFDNNGGWAKVNATIQPNAAVSPDGTLSADLLVEADEASGTNSHYAKQNTLSSVAVGDTYTWTVFAKAAGRNYATIYTTVGGANTYGIWNLLDGSVTTTSGGGSFSSSDCGNGWYRLQVTFTTTTTSGGSTYFYVASDGSTFGYAGNGYGSVLLWGANLTETVSSVSYVKAESSTVTKAVDSCSVALSDIGITSGQDLTAIVEGDAGEIAGASIIGFDDGSSSNYARITRHANNNYTFDVRTDASSQAVITLGSSSSATNFAFRVENNNIGAAADGSSVTTDTSATIGLMTTMQIGDGHWSGPTDGTISRVSIYSEALSDANLTALTS